MKPEIYTTFALCRKARACEPGYKQLAKILGGVRRYGKDKPIPLASVLESNGLDDALWVLQNARAGKDAERIAYLFAADCAARVLEFFERAYPNDSRPREAIMTARRFARGQATVKELDAAVAAARVAACVAVAAARVAAGAAVAAAAGAAAGAAWAARAAWVAEAKWLEKQLRAYLAGTAKSVPMRSDGVQPLHSALVMP
jgi:hypothetical protein